MSAPEKSTSEGLGIWSSFVKYQGRSGEYVIGLDASGIKAAPAEKDGKPPPGLEPFFLAWSDVDAVEQKFGFFHWGMILQLRARGPCEIWLLYEHFPPPVFHQIAAKFSDRTSFRASSRRNWKVVALPLAFAVFWGALAAWASWSNHAAGAMLLGLAGLASVAYAAWIWQRTTPTRSQI